MTTTEMNTSLHPAHSVHPGALCRNALSASTCQSVELFQGGRELLLVSLYKTTSLMQQGDVLHSSLWNKQ